MAAGPGLAKSSHSLPTKLYVKHLNEPKFIHFEYSVYSDQLASLEGSQTG